MLVNISRSESEQLRDSGNLNKMSGVSACGSLLVDELARLFGPWKV